MDLWYFGAFVALMFCSVWAAFKLGRIVRWCDGEERAERVTWEQLERMPTPDYGPHELGKAGEP